MIENINTRIFISQRFFVPASLPIDPEESSHYQLVTTSSKVLRHSNRRSRKANEDGIDVTSRLRRNDDSHILSDIPNPKTYEHTKDYRITFEFGVGLTCTDDSKSIAS